MLSRPLKGSQRFTRYVAPMPSTLRVPWPSAYPTSSWLPGTSGSTPASSPPVWRLRRRHSEGPIVSLFAISTNDGAYLRNGADGYRHQGWSIATTWCPSGRVGLGICCELDVASVGDGRSVFGGDS